MTLISSTVLIERPKGEVFDFAADIRNELMWNPGIQSMEKITDGPVGLGTKAMAKRAGRGSACRRSIWLTKHEPRAYETQEP